MRLYSYFVLLIYFASNFVELRIGLRFWIYDLGLNGIDLLTFLFYGIEYIYIF